MQFYYQRGTESDANHPVESLLGGRSSRGTEPDGNGRPADRHSRRSQPRLFVPGPAPRPKDARMAGTATYVQEIAAQVAAGRLEALVNGTLFRSIRGVQSKLDLINTPNALESLSRWARFPRRGVDLCAPARARRGAPQKRRVQPGEGLAEVQDARCAHRRPKMGQAVLRCGSGCDSTSFASLHDFPWCKLWQGYLRPTVAGLEEGGGGQEEVKSET